MTVSQNRPLLTETAPLDLDLIRRNLSEPFAFRPTPHGPRCIACSLIGEHGPGCPTAYALRLLDEVELLRRHSHALQGLHAHVDEFFAYEDAHVRRDNTITDHFAGREYEVHICDDCEQFWPCSAEKLRAGLERVLEELG